MSLIVCSIINTNNLKCYSFLRDGDLAFYCLIMFTSLDRIGTIVVFQTEVAD